MRIGWRFLGLWAFAAAATAYAISPGTDRCGEDDELFGISGLYAPGLYFENLLRDFAEGTVEEQVGKVMVERIAAASDMVGSDATGLVDLAQLLGADWLPSTALTEDGP